MRWRGTDDDAGPNTIRSILQVILDVVGGNNICGMPEIFQDGETHNTMLNVPDPGNTATFSLCPPFAVALEP